MGTTWGTLPPTKPWGQPTWSSLLFCRRQNGPFKWGRAKSRNHNLRWSRCPALQGPPKCNCVSTRDPKALRDIVQFVLFIPCHIRLDFKKEKKNYVDQIKKKCWSDAKTSSKHSACTNIWRNHSQKLSSAWWRRNDVSSVCFLNRPANIKKGQIVTKTRKVWHESDSDSFRLMLCCRFDRLRVGNIFSVVPPLSWWIDSFSDFRTFRRSI